LKNSEQLQSIYLPNGFTLIELIVVIVMIGAFSAVAVPKFVNLSSDAKQAAMNYAAGVIKSGALIVHSKVAIYGIPTDSAIRQLALTDGTTIEIQNGYPACTANGIPIAAGTSNNYIWYLGGSNLCTLYPNMGKDGSGNTIYNGTCAVVYDSTTGGTWTPVTSGC
jgi:MSHA pilin protein MshA